MISPLQAQLGKMGLDVGLVTQQLFAQPLVQSLLKDFDEDMEAGTEAEKSQRLPNRREMWMNPAAALELLEQRAAVCERIKHKFDVAE